MVCSVGNEGVHGALQCRGAGGASVEGPAHEPVEQQVARAFLVGRRKPGRADRVRHVEAADPVGQAPAEERRGARFEEGVASHLRVERLKTPGGAEQHPRGVVPPSHGEGDPRAEQFRMRLPVFVQRAGEGGADEPQCGIERPGGGLGSRGGKGPLGAGFGVGRQPDGVFEEGSGRNHAPAGLCLSGAVFEFGSQLLVGRGRAVRAVPDMTIGLGVRVGRGGKRAVDRLALTGRRGAVDRRANQRVAEPHALAELAQVRRGHRLIPHPIDSGVLRRAPHDRRIAQRLGGCDQQKALRHRRQFRRSALEALLDPGGQTLRSGKTEAARELGLREPTR